MAAGRQITVEFLGNTRNLDKALNATGSKTSTLGSKLAKVGKVAAYGLGAGVAIAAKGLYEMGQGAIQDQASAAKLATVLENAAGATKGQVAATEDWITAQGKAYGIADDDLRPALARLVTATHDVGEAQKLASLAMDVSAGSGKSLESVSTALMKAQNGQVSALSRLGINTKNAAGETISMEQATKRMADTFGGSAAKQADTMQGKMARLKLMLSETGEAIGYKLIPVVTAAADFFLNKFIPAVGKASDWFNKNLMPAIRGIGDTVKKVFGGMDGDVSGPMADVISTIKSAVSIIQSLWKRFGGILTAFTKGTFKNMFTIVKGAFKVIAGIFKVFSSLLKGDWKGVWQGIKQILSGAFAVLKGMFKQFFAVAKTLFRLGWSAIKGIFSGAWDGIKQLVANGIGKVVDVIRGVPGKIRALGGNFRDAGKAVIGALIDGLKNAGGFVSDIAGNVWNALRGMLNAAIDKINSALEFKINLPGPDISVNPTNIPHMARGGIVTRPTLALIGEDGPEAVVPLGRKHAPKGRLSAGGGDIYITVNGALDPDGVARQVHQLLLKRKRTTGNLGLT